MPARLTLAICVAATGVVLDNGDAAAQQQQAQHHAGGNTATHEVIRLGNMNVPDVVLTDQDGNDVRFYTDLIKGKTVVINTVFTTCTTICPTMGVNFARLQRELGDRADEVHLISVSVDPLVDTPPRLKAWRDQFRAQPGWTLVTGAKAQVDEVLKGLKVFTADKLDHTPTVLLGNDETGEWTRAHGLAPPSTLAELVIGMLGEATQWRSPAHEYFTDVALVDQNGVERRLFTDLLENKVVVIQAMFTSCEASCPIMVATLKRIQDWLGDRLGDEVFLLSISVDPETDTPTVMKAYADNLGAKDGWYFLTGDKPNVDGALYKLGQYVETPEGHSNVVIIGNTRTGLWKKAAGLAPANDVIAVLESVLNDRG